MQRRLISAPGTTTNRWVYLPATSYMSVREVVVMATCFSKNAKGPPRPGDPPPPDRPDFHILTGQCLPGPSVACLRKRTERPPRVL